MSGPAFFVAGVQKAGTSALDACLRRHPAFCPPAIKEAHLFDDDRLAWDRPEAIKAEMARRFAGAGGLTYDATPSYCFWPGAMERIAQVCPDARLILLFRDPAARAWSHWAMNHARGIEPLPFAEAIAAERGRLAACAPGSPDIRRFSYVARGHYGQQLARALALFGRERLLLLRAGDLRSRQEATLARVARFLDLPPFPEMPAIRAHCAAPAYAAGPSPVQRAAIMGRLAEDRALFSILCGLTLDEPAPGDPEFRQAGLPDRASPLGHHGLEQVRMPSSV